MTERRAILADSLARLERQAGILREKIARIEAMVDAVEVRRERLSAAAGRYRRRRIGGRPMNRPSIASSRGLSAFGHRNYRLFFGGQLISLIGTWMTSVAQSWLILQLTGNPFDLGLLTVAQFGPVLVLGLFGGLIADGLPKRRTMYVTQTVAMGVSFAAVRARRSTGTVAGLAGLRRSRPSWASGTRSTCPPARRSRSRWSAARTSATRSP